MEFGQLKKNLKKPVHGFKTIRLAVLADSTTQLIVQAIRGLGYEYSFDLQVFEADFNQIDRQILDFTSELYRYHPEVIIIFESSHKLLTKFNKLDIVQRRMFADNQIAHVDLLMKSIQQQLPAKIIYLNLAEIDDAVFGNYANKIPESYIFQLRKFNYLLMEKAMLYSNLFICDLSGIQNRFGKTKLFSPSIYVGTEMVLSLEILPELALQLLCIIGAMQGIVKKCLILDLDNTLWGGIIGDDGLENIQLGSLGIGKAFTELQYWIKSLKERGILLAICSKNNDTTASEPFEKHPDMILHCDDIAVFMANWDNKADNIKKIQQLLNIGFDAMVFLDDNPFERNMVRENIPGICVPELPDDPANYLEYLYGLNLFETTSNSNEDAERTKLYQTEAKRMVFQQSFTNEDDFLRDMHMVSLTEPFNAFNTPRVAQLSQRSNQFNLRTIRYTESDIEAIAHSDNHYTYAFTLEDKFGNNGLICALILKKVDDSSLFIDTWLMSCRVLKRGMEQFVLNTIFQDAKNNGYARITGEYIPTAKNMMVKDHYQNFGFEPLETVWIKNVDNFQLYPCYIQSKSV